MTDFGLLLIRVSFENPVEEIVVDRHFNGDPFKASPNSTFFPTLHNTMPFNPFLGQPEELERNRNSNRSSTFRGPSERRRAQAARESRSALSSPIQQRHHRRRTTEEWREEESRGSEGVFFGEKTRNRTESSSIYFPHSTLQTPRRWKQKELQGFYPEGCIRPRPRLTHMDSMSDVTSSIEESLV